MSTLYPYEEKKDKKVINKFALLNGIIGIPTLAFLIFLLVKGLLGDYLIIGYSSVAILLAGICYSLFKLIKR